MPINFPSSPSVNQTYTYESVTWKYNGTVWRIEVTDPGYATQTYVNTQIDDLIDGSPNNRNTLNELSTAIDTKAPTSNPTFTGEVTASALTVESVRHRYTAGASITAGRPVSYDLTTGKVGPSNCAIEAGGLYREQIYAGPDDTSSQGVIPKPNERSTFMVFDRYTVRAGNTGSSGNATISSGTAPFFYAGGSVLDFAFYERRSGHFVVIRDQGSGTCLLQMFSHANPPVLINSTTFSTNYSHRWFYSYNSGQLMLITTASIARRFYWSGSAWVENSTPVSLPGGFNPTFLWDSSSDNTKFKVFNNQSHVEVTWNSGTEGLTVGGLVSNVADISWYSPGYSRCIYPDDDFIYGERASDSFAVIVGYDLTSYAAQLKTIDEMLADVQEYDNTLLEMSGNGLYTVANDSPVIGLGNSQFVIPLTQANYAYQIVGPGSTNLILLHYNAITNTYQSVGKTSIPSNTEENWFMAYDNDNNNLLMLYNHYTPYYDETTEVCVFHLGVLANMTFPAENFVGIAQTSASADQTVKLATAGEISTSHSGLNASSRVYIGTNSISYTPYVYSQGDNYLQSNYIGRAISSSQILVERSPVALSRANIGYEVVSNASNSNQMLAEAFDYDSYNGIVSLDKLEVNEFYYKAGDYFHRTGFFGSGYVSGTNYTLPAGYGAGAIEILTIANSGTNRQYMVINFLKAPGVSAVYDIVSNVNLSGNMITISGLTDAGVLSWTKTGTNYSFITVKFSRS